MGVIWDNYCNENPETCDCLDCTNYKEGGKRYAKVDTKEATPS